MTTVLDHPITPSLIAPALVPDPSPDPIVTLRGVRMRYGSIIALDGIDLDVKPGEIVAILGPNGAGKTTAISIMLGLRRATEGSVAIFGRDPLDRVVRERLGAMLQESGVPSTLHVDEVVDLFRGYYPVALPRDEVLAAADLLDVAQRPVGKLSGGQRQRLYFALALAGDPDLLFLDEPTVGMDVAARHAFWARIGALAALGKTIVFSTHLLEEADALATRIVVIDHGRVVASGTPSEVKSRVAGKRIRVRGDIPAATLAALPGARVVGHEGAYLILAAEDAMPVLRALMSLGSLVEEVTVEEAGLEAAFLGLTDEGIVR
ncbi:MAG: ABC transporter ATP-binding protein [Chloroflexota bacterium]|nr:ABC transporter ATP-binding protein [Chloroflexota bacterium]